MAGVRTRGLPMSHNSDRHKIQKRERTHMLNAKYGRHGNGGHGRRGHRTHANRRFPAQRGIDDTTRLADATIHYGSDAFYVSHDVLGDALSGKAPHDRIERVGSTAWRTSPDGKLVKVVVVNVKRAQEYNDRRKLRDMLNEMDKNEGLPSERDLASAHASQDESYFRQDKPNGRSETQNRPKDINELPLTTQEVIGEQILYEEQANSTMDDMRRRIDELRATIASQSSTDKGSHEAKEARQTTTMTKRGAVASTAAAGGNGDVIADANAKSVNGRNGKGNGTSRRRQRNGTKSRTASGGGNARGSGAGTNTKAGNGHGSEMSLSQRLAARRQTLALKRMERIRQRIKFAQAIGNDRLARRLQASLDSMMKKYAAPQNVKGKGR